MNELNIINRDGILAVDSREVAEMVGKEHNKLIRDIRTYCEYLGQSNFGHSDFFIESTYQSAQNKTMPCYLITRKGCDMVANKMTGEKGVLFTAAYVDKFYKMEEKLKGNIIPSSLPEALRFAAELAEQKEKLALEVTQKTQIIGELKPKADYLDKLLKNKGLVTTTAIAKDYGMSAKTFNRTLHDLSIQFKQSGQWFLYAKYQDRGYTQSETVDITHKDGSKDVKMNTKWTQKGRLFLYDLLKENSLLPIIEQDKSA